MLSLYVVNPYIFFGLQHKEKSNAVSRQLPPLYLTLLYYYLVVASLEADILRSIFGPLRYSSTTYYVVYLTFTWNKLRMNFGEKTFKKAPHIRMVWIKSLAGFALSKFTTAVTVCHWNGHCNKFFHLTWYKFVTYQQNARNGDKNFFLLFLLHSVMRLILINEVKKSHQTGILLREAAWRAVDPWSKLPVNPNPLWKLCAKLYEWKNKLNYLSILKRLIMGISTVS